MLLTALTIPSSKNEMDQVVDAITRRARLFVRYDRLLWSQEV